MRNVTVKWSVKKKKKQKEDDSLPKSYELEVFVASKSHQDYHIEKLSFGMPFEI